MSHQFTDLRNALTQRFHPNDVPRDIRVAVERAEGKFVDMAAEKVKAAAAAEVADEVLSEEHNSNIARLAEYLEPIFAAIQLGDIDRARGGVRALHDMLCGDDPIIVAIQRAKSRPYLTVHVAA